VRLLAKLRIAGSEEAGDTGYTLSVAKKQTGRNNESISCFPDLIILSNDYKAINQLTNYANASVSDGIA